MGALGLLLLLGLLSGGSAVIHSLRYFHMASSGLSSFPEFVAVGMVDEVQIVHYDSVSKRAVPKQAWMDQVTRERPDYWDWQTGRYQGQQQWYKDNVETAKKRFNQTGGSHVFQRMTGCEWDDEDDTTDGHHQHAYDGEDFIALDLKTLTWECVEWLKKYLAYGKSTLQRIERPRVSLLQRSPSSPVVCHATGFYPDRVVVFWRRDGQELHEQVDPGEVLPNHDGTFQVSVDLDLTAVPQEDWGRYECVVQLKGIEDISTPLDPALIRTNGGKSHLLVFLLVGVAVAAVVVAAAAVGVFVYQKRNASDKRHKPVGSSDSCSENTEGQNPAPEAQPLTTTSLSETNESKEFWLHLVVMTELQETRRPSSTLSMGALGLLLLLGLLSGGSAVIHSLRYFETASSGLSSFPEFVSVGMVDEVQMFHYDSVSKRAVPKQAWMDQVTRDRPDYWEEETGRNQGIQQWFKGNIETAKKRFNQTGGAHIVQMMSGCEWDDEDDTTDGHDQHAYDGEDFIAFDLKTLTWVGPSVRGVSLLQRSPSSPVVCHATGFYPDRVVVFWRRDGQELHEQVDPGEVLPNHDGTFQVSVDLDLTAVPQEDWGRYECVVQLKGIEDISTPLDPALIRTNWGKTGRDGGLPGPFLVAGSVAGALLLVGALVLAGVCWHRKRNGSAKRPAAGLSAPSESSALSGSQRNRPGLPGWDEQFHLIDQLALAGPLELSNAEH
ncbi:unnamed protein product [Boreogadus saida]